MISRWTAHVDYFLNFFTESETLWDELLCHEHPVQGVVDFLDGNERYSLGYEQDASVGATWMLEPCEADDSFVAETIAALGEADFDEVIFRIDDAGIGLSSDEWCLPNGTQWLQWGELPKRREPSKDFDPARYRTLLINAYNPEPVEPTTGIGCASVHGLAGWEVGGPDHGRGMFGVNLVVDNPAALANALMWALDQQRQHGADNESEAYAAIALARAAEAAQNGADALDFLIDEAVDDAGMKARVERARERVRRAVAELEATAEEFGIQRLPAAD